MTIKFVKKIEITGEVWYNIFANDSCIKSFRDENEAKKMYLTIIENADKGWPIVEILASQEFPNL